MDLSAPRVKQATGTAPSQQLNPVAAKDALTVVIPEYGFQPGDQVRVTWAGTAGDGSHTTPAQALPPSREIPVPVEVLAYNLGKPVTVTYTVTRNGETSDPSAALNLAVQTIASGDLQAARPKILQAENNGDGAELYLSAINADVTCWVGIWPLIAPDQDVWLRLKGTKADGTSPYDLNIWAPPPRGPRTSPTWIAQGFYDNVKAAYNYLKELKDGSTLTMELKADFSKTTDEANAQTFPLRTYTFKLEMVKPTIDSLKDANDKEVPDSTFERYTVSRQLKLSGQASKGRDVAIVDDWFGDEVLRGQATANPLTGTWECTIAVGLGDYYFYAKALYPISPVYSAVRRAYVVPLIDPTLTNVTDTADYNEIPDGDSTSSTEVKLYGRASRGQTIEVFDGSGASAVSKGEVKNDTNGYWALRITVALGGHRFYAKSLYHSGAPVYSNVRRLTVVRP